MQSGEVEVYIRQKFAANTGIADEQLFADGTTLANVIGLSPQMTNSIDLMEAFARTANGLRKDYGVRVKLPTLPLDTPTGTVLTAFLEEYDRQKAKEAAA
jgi:hypothetical protein